MALETSGFQLSQFERAPQIPGNIGVVDTKAIYGAVVDSLKANEALRTTQAVQAATDAELVLARQKAQAEAGLLGPESEARRAKAQLFTAGAPLEMELLGPRATAERAKLAYDTALSGELAKPENVAAAARSKTLSTAARGVYELARMAADPTQPKEVRDAAGVKIQTIQSANQRFRSALDSGKVDFHTTNADGTTYVRFRDGSTGIIGFPETYTGNAAAYLSGPITGGMAAPVSAGAVPTGAVTPLVPTGMEDIPVGAFAPTTATGAPAPRPAGAMLSGVAPGTGGVRAPTKAGLLATQSAVKFGGEASPLAGIEGDEVKKEALSTAAKMGDEARKEIRTQLTNLNTFETEARKEDDIQKELDALIAEANEKGIMISGGSFLGRGLRALAPGEAAAFQSRLGSIIQHIQLGNMLRLKNASSTGATGFGNLTESENKLLQADYGALSDPNLPSESLVSALERAKRGLNFRRQEALDTIRGRLAVERGIEQQSSSFFQGAKDRFVIPRHRLEAVEEAPSALPSLEGDSLFSSIRSSMIPGRLGMGAEAPAAPAPAAPGGETPPPAPSGIKVTAIDGKPVQDSGSITVGRFTGTKVQAPAPAPAPAVTEEPRYQYPAYSVLGAAERMPSMPPIGETAMNVAAAPGRAIDAFGRLGAAALQGAMTGDYQVPEKGLVQRAGEAIGGVIAGRTVGEERELMRREDDILRTRPNSWEAYDIRRKRGMPEPARQGPGYTRTATAEEFNPPAAPVAREQPAVVEATVTEAPPAPIRLSPEQVAELSQITLSPESTRTARRLLSEYQAGQRAGRREQPVLEITASDGKRRSFVVESPDVADQLIAILTGQQPPNLEPRLETDREATRRLTEDRMRREEMARQLRTTPRR